MSDSMPMQAKVLPLSDIVRPTTLIEATRLNRRLGLDVVLVSETFQHTGSFKFRAAYNLASKVPQSGVLTASSGNFGQAMAYACAILGKTCRVVMPDTSAKVKIDAVRDFGGEVDLIDVRQISRSDRVTELARQYPDLYVASAYDDPLVIEGNASLGIEIAKRVPSCDLIVAPVGGGGLTAGLITGIQSVGATIEVIGSEPVIANDAARSLRAGERISLPSEPLTLADGARTLSVGIHNWKILQTGLTQIVEISEEAIREAVRLLFLLANLKAEPTGALSFAALIADPDQFRDRTVCCVISGGNVDPGLYSKLLSS